MFAQLGAATACLYADQSYVLVGNEFVECADGIRTTANTGQHGIGQAAFGFENLPTRFDADDSLEIANHGGVGMSTKHAAEEIVGCANIDDPIAHGFVDRVFQRSGAGIDAAHFGTEQAHAVDVQFLPTHVL